MSYSEEQQLQMGIYQDIETKLVLMKPKIAAIEDNPSTLVAAVESLVKAEKLNRVLVGLLEIFKELTLEAKP